MNGVYGFAALFKVVAALPFSFKHNTKYFLTFYISDLPIVSSRHSLQKFGVVTVTVRFRYASCLHEVAANQRFRKTNLDAKSMCMPWQVMQCLPNDCLRMRSHPAIGLDEIGQRSWVCLAYRHTGNAIYPAGSVTKACMEKEAMVCWIEC